MRLTLGVALTALLFGPSVFAASSDTMAGLYSKTVAITDRGTGAVSTLWLNSDHSYIAVVSQNGMPTRVTGIWAPQPNGSTVCLSPRSMGGISTPATAGCIPLGGHAAGDSWTAANDSNQQLDFAVSAGQ